MPQSTITIKDTNVIILYGDGAVANYTKLVNTWTRMIPALQWGYFQFILAGTKSPKLDLREDARKLVGNNNTRFYRIPEKNPEEDKLSSIPTTAAYHNLISDKVKTGKVYLHIVYDPGDNKCSTTWLQGLIQSAVSDRALTTTCLYYLFFGRNSYTWEKDQLTDLLKKYPGPTFMLSDTNENGGHVTSEERLHAAILAILANAAEMKPILLGAYTLGYSVLNAYNSELQYLNENAACDIISEEIKERIENFTNIPTLKLLPEGLSTISELRKLLENRIRKDLPSLSPIVMKNAWATIRMQEELPPEIAIERMKRFADLNYAGDNNAKAARDYAAQVQNRLMQTLQENVLTAALSEKIFIRIADELEKIAREDIQPARCEYPKRHINLFGRKKQNEEYLQECKSKVIKSIKDYIVHKNVSCYAEELRKVYQDAALWLKLAHGESDTDSYRIKAEELLRDIQRELASEESGNVHGLAKKYKNYNAALEQLKPRFSELTEGINEVFYEKDASINENSWRILIHEAGKKLSKKIKPEFRGRFFEILQTEFSTPEEREKFFNEYLKNGQKMYKNHQVKASPGMQILLADTHLTDKWFMEKELYEVKTDNAENLTIYPLGEETAEWYLEQEDEIYFLMQEKENGTDASGNEMENEELLFPDHSEDDGGGLLNQESSNDELQQQEEPKQDNNQLHDMIRLEPDQGNAYRLYWMWHENDDSAMVELQQDGIQIGKIAAISVKQFQDNGNNMNVTEDIMGGKQIPIGMISVIIRDARKKILYDSVKVMGRRNVVKYKISGQKLELIPDERSNVREVVLRTTETDGTHHFFPLYPSHDEKEWLFEGLSLSDSKIVKDPTCSNKTVFPVRIK